MLCWWEWVGLRPRMIGSWFWVIISVKRVYVDNLGPTGTGETLPKFWWKFWWNLYIYIKKNLPEIFPIYCEKEGRKIRAVTQNVHNYRSDRSSRSKFFHEFPEAVFHGDALNRYDTATASGRSYSTARQE